MRKMLPAVVATCVCTSASFGGVLKSQTFDSAASAAASGWTEIGSRNNGNNFGFSNSTNAGGVSGSGEGGGLMQRSGNESAYVDTTIGSLSMNDAQSFSGAFAWTAAGAGYAPAGFSLFVAYYDTNRTSSADPRDNSYAGFSINERSSNANTVRVNLEFNSASGTGLGLVSGSGPDVVSNQIILDKTTKYTYTWDYNPSAGANGQVTLEFFDASRPLGQELRGTIVGDLTATQRTEGALHNQFGIVNEFWGGFGSTANNNVTAFVDDLTYTVVPEPTSLTLSLVGFGLLIRRRRKH